MSTPVKEVFKQETILNNMLLGNTQVNKEPDGSEIVAELLANQAGRCTLIQLRMANALT